MTDIKIGDTSQVGAIRCPDCGWIIIPAKVLPSNHINNVVEVTCPECGALMRVFVIVRYDAELLAEGSNQQTAKKKNAPSGSTDKGA